MRNILILGVAALALTACSKTGADKDGDGKISESEVKTEAGKVKLEAGEWENSVTITDVKIENLPAGAPAGIMDSMKGKVTTSKSCITKEQVDNPGADFFNAQKDSKCEMSKFTMSGGKIDVAMTCKNMGAPGEMNMLMSGDYQPASYDMKMNMKSNAGGMKMDISAHNVGKRIGDCPA